MLTYRLKNRSGFPDGKKGYRFDFCLGYIFFSGAPQSKLVDINFTIEENKNQTRKIHNLLPQVAMSQEDGFHREQLINVFLQLKRN